MDSINKYIEENFPEKLKAHTEGVRKTAVRLAGKYGADVKKAETAALFHDMFRAAGAEVLNGYVKCLGLDEKYLGNPNLAHAKVAAAVMERDYGIRDRDILNAVSYHTTGRAGMSKLEKVVYLADAIEPGRVYPGADRLRRIAEEDLDKACLAALQNTAGFVRSRGDFLDRDTLFAERDLEKRRD